METCKAKLSIIGAGSIGSAVAYTLALRRPNTEIVLVNRDQRKAWAKAFDVSHCLPELPGRTIREGPLEASAGSAVIVMTVGTLPRENGTRAEVLGANLDIYRALVPALAALSPEAVFLVVSNPVDAMAYATQRLSGFPAARVLGSGTELDSLRLRSFTAAFLGLEASRLSLNIAGEHGESMVPLWSLGLLDGKPLPYESLGLDEAARTEILHRTKRAGWDIREAGEHSSLGIAFSATRIVEALLESSEGSFSVSTAMQGEYGIEKAYLSLPSLLSRAGVIGRLEPDLSDSEVAALSLSASAVARQMAAVDGLLA